MDKLPNPLAGDADVGIPQLSERLTAVVRGLRDDIDSLPQRVLTGIQAAIGDYANLSDRADRPGRRPIRAIPPAGMARHPADGNTNVAGNA